ncbi:phage tail tape measure protein [Aquitalea sp. ASV11]|uniref:phage tail tape measure protein n=1 Tax=Aquitalea sp. ASV11 TaxID=2795103 RepID=UPI0018EDBF8A|nr:phage tail tape measure protein [Aquitalea sp. ASV11]
MSNKLRLEVVLAAVDKMTRPLKDAMAGSKGLAATVKATREQLSALNKTQGSISAWRKLSSESKDIKKNLEGAKQKLEEVRAQMEKDGQSSEKLARQFAKAEKAVETLTMAHRKKLQATREASAALDKEGISTSNLASHETDLKNRIAATNAVLKTQEEELAKVGRRQQQLVAAKAKYSKSMEARDKVAGAGASSLAAGGAAGAALAAPVGAYAQAENAAMQLRVAMMGKGGKVSADFEKINALAEKLGNKLPGTTAELQDMMTMLSRQGMSSMAILGGVGEAAAYMGVQLKLPYQTAAEYAAKLQDATGALESDMMGVMDTIQRTYQVGVDPSNMVAAFAKLSPVLDMIKQKGLSGAKAMAPLLAMADQSSLVGESAGNAFRKVFDRSIDAKKVAKANKMIAKEGIKLDFTNGKGDFGSIEQLFAQVAKLKKLNAQQFKKVVSEIWGDDAETLQALNNVILKNGIEGYREMQQKMEAQASLQERVNAQLGTLANLWDAASGTFTNGLVKFGEAIAPELKELTQWITDVSESMGKWATENPRLANVLMKVVGIAAIGLTAFGGLALAIAGVMGPFIMMRLAAASLGIKLTSGIGILGKLGTVLGWIGRVIAFVGRLFLFNPISLVITAIATGAYLIWRNWDTLGPKFAAMWEAIKAAFASGWEWVKSSTSAALQWFFNLPARFVELGSQIMQGMVRGIETGLGKVKDAITGAGDATITWFKEKLGIHSPSRVFAQLGSFTMAGLQQGIAGGQDGPLSAVLGVAKRLTTAGAITLGMAGTAMAMQLDQRGPMRATPPAAAVAAPAPISIVIHAAPGMDEKALAQAVARELAKQQNQQAANRRSRWGDSD